MVETLIGRIVRSRRGADAAKATLRFLTHISDAAARPEPETSSELSFLIDSVGTESGKTGELMWPRSKQNSRVNTSTASNKMPF